MKGLGMASIPSIGHIKTTEVPRQTTSPSALVSSNSLYGSSGSKIRQIKKCIQIGLKQHHRKGLV